MTMSSSSIVALKQTTKPTIVPTVSVYKDPLIEKAPTEVTIIGDGKANVLRGLSGNDTFTGGGGNDTYVGLGDGNYTFDDSSDSEQPYASNDTYIVTPGSTISSRG